MRINLFGGPCTGKSTTAAWLFSELKQRGYNIELVTEYVKSWAWEGRIPTSYDQVYLFAKQMHREEILTRRAVHIVTDSPLPLQLVYVQKHNCPFFEELKSICKKFDKDHPSTNFLLSRSMPFQPYGRYETPQEAAELDRHILSVLDAYGSPCVIIDPIKDKDHLLRMAEEALKK